MHAIRVLNGIRVDIGFIACRTISSGNSSGSCGLPTSHECLSQNGKTAAGNGPQHTVSKTVGEIADVRQHALELGTDQGVRWLWVAAIGVGPEEKYPSTGSAD